jgi:hypothetical protein
MIDRQEARSDVARIDPAADRWIHKAKRARATTDPLVVRLARTQGGWVVLCGPPRTPWSSRSHSEKSRTKRVHPGFLVEGGNDTFRSSESR